MNRITLILQTILLLGFLVSSNTSNASHITGADISYQQISSLKYKVTYKIFRNCKDLPLNTPDFKVSCDNGTNIIIFSATRTSIKDISVVCSKDTLPCKPQNTTVNAGMEEHVFETIIDFNLSPYKAIKNNCCKAVFSISACCRNGAVTNISPGNFYLDAMLDLCLIGSKGNSSPVFKTHPLLEICCNQPFVYNNGGVELAEGDSLSFESSVPLKGLNDPETYTGNFSNSVMMTPYCPPNPGTLNCTPIPGAKPPRGMFFDQSNGDIIFTPIGCTEVGVINFKVIEWRRDSSGKMVQIGYVKRESTWFVKTCNDNNPPYFTGNNKYTVCEGNKLCFTIGTKDDAFLPKQTTLDTITVSWDSAIPGAVFRIIDPSAREKDIEFCWQTKESDSKEGAYRFTVKAKDDVCSSPLVVYKTFSIQVKPKATDIRKYSTGTKGSVTFEAIPQKGGLSNTNNYTYQFTIRDSTNSGAPLYLGYKRLDSFKFNQTGKYIIEHQINNPPINCPTNYFDTLIITPAHLVSTDQVIKTDLQLFPNPGNGWIHFVSDGIDLKEAYIKIYASDGRLITVQKLVDESADLRFLASGIYTLALESGDTSIFRKLIIE